MNLKRLKWLANYYWGAISNLMVLDRRKLYAAWEYTQLAQLLKHFEVDCVFDVGANVGQYAEMLRRKAGYKGLIISFEPIPEAAAELRRKAEADPKWVVIEGALGEADGQQVFNIMAASQFSSLSAPKHDEAAQFQDLNKVSRQVPVKIETLQTALRRLQAEHQFKRPFLKLDTQGFDVRIVQAGAPVVKEFIGLQSEMAVAKLYADSVDFRDALRVYEQSGFVLSAFVPNNAGHFPRLIETDCIMVRADLV
ncbi:MAG: FkbM family methyltransferase [Inhella sp.]|jgi:FkbM family methyltransferase